MGEVEGWSCRLGLRAKTCCCDAEGQGGGEGSGMGPTAEANTRARRAIVRVFQDRMERISSQ